MNMRYDTYLDAQDQVGLLKFGDQHAVSRIAANGDNRFTASLEQVDNFVASSHLDQQVHEALLEAEALLAGLDDITICGGDVPSPGFPEASKSFSAEAAKTDPVANASSGSSGASTSRSSAGASVMFHQQSLHQSTKKQPYLLAAEQQQHSVASPFSTVPPGWTTATDPTDGRIFYLETATGRRSWIHPHAPGAEQATEKASIVEWEGILDDLSFMTASEGQDEDDDASFATANDELLPQVTILQLLEKGDIWINGILPFVGPGHFLFVALVCRRFKVLYLDYFSTLPRRNRPKVWCDHLGGPEPPERKKRVGKRDTYYRHAFSNVSCVQFWKAHPNRDLEVRTKTWCFWRSGYTSFVCNTAARHGNLEVLQWARKEGFHWDEQTMACADQNGHLHIVLYAFENGCPWHGAHPFFLALDDLE